MPSPIELVEAAVEPIVEKTLDKTTSPRWYYLGLIPVIIMAIDPGMHKVIGDNPFWSMFVASVIAGSAYLAKSPLHK